MSSETAHALARCAGVCAVLTLRLAFVPSSWPADNSIWTSIGPDGGTVSCIAIDPLAPATLYAGTTGGGIFKSTDKGGSWIAVNNGLTDFSVGTIAVDPKNTGTVYGTTYSPGLNGGLFKSTNGGQTWIPIGSGLPGFIVGPLAIDPVSSDTIYAGTTGAGISKSTDGGHSWTAVNAGLPEGVWIVDLALDGLDPGTLYVGTGRDGVFKSRNGGQTWTAVNTGLPSLSLDALTIDPQDPNVLYAGIDGYETTGVWKTVNGGGSWNPVAGVGLPKFNVVASLVIDPNNPKTIYVVGYLPSNTTLTGIYRSSDGGDTWTALNEVPDSQIPPLAIDLQNSSTIYAGSIGSGMFKSSDGGTTWIHSSRGLSAVGVYGLTVDHSNSATIYAGTYQGVFKSTDSGSTWSRKISDPTAPVVIDPSNPATIYAISIGYILKSTDGGETWRNLPGIGDVDALAIDPNNPKTLYAGISSPPYGPGSSATGVYRTDDGGETWRPANVGLPTGRNTIDFVAVDPRNSATVYAATFYGSPPPDGSVYRSTDGGGTWTQINTERAITAMALDTQNAGTIYAATSGKGLLKTVDGGDSWIQLGNMLNDKSIKALAVEGTPSVLYAGTPDGDVFRSTDGGVSWTQLRNGPTMPAFYALAVDPKSVETAYAGTLGGVFKLVPMVSAFQLDVPALGADVASTAERKDPVQSGYATFRVDSGPVASGVAVFSFRQNGVVASEAGVPASPPTRSARIFVEYRTGVAVTNRDGVGTIDVYTGLALVNRSSSDANLTYTLRNVSGAVVAGGHGSLAAGAHYAKFVNQLSTEAPDFRLPEDFPTAEQFGSLDITSDQPLSVLALRLTINQRDEALLTTTPTADLTQPLGSGRLYFPHIADGGGYVTKLILLNTSNAPEAGTMSFYGEDGTPLIVNRAQGYGGSNVPYSIQPGGVFVFQTDGTPVSVNQGSVQLTPYAGTSTPMGAGVFGISRNGVLVSESGIPAAEPTTHARIYVDQSGSHGTGLALSALSGSGLRVALKAYQMDGSTPAGSAAAQIALNQNGHSARFISQLIPGLPSDFTGILDISAESPFAALTIRSLTNDRGDLLLTTFPVLDLNRLPSSPPVFPQIADGGGYVTQFILLGAAGPTKATLQLWDDSGAPLTIGKP